MRGGDSRMVLHLLTIRHLKILPRSSRLDGLLLPSRERCYLYLMLRSFLLIFRCVGSPECIVFTSDVDLLAIWRGGGREVGMDL